MLGNWGPQRGGEGAWRSKELMLGLGWLEPPACHLHRGDVPDRCSAGPSLPLIPLRAWPAGATQGRPPAADPPLRRPPGPEPRGGGLPRAGPAGAQLSPVPQGMLTGLGALLSVSPLGFSLSFHLGLSPHLSLCFPAFCPICLLSSGFPPSSFPLPSAAILSASYSLFLSLFHIFLPFSLPLIFFLSLPFLCSAWPLLPPYVLQVSF